MKADTSVGAGLSIVRDNLMTREGYSPYCGNETCRYRWPRTHFVDGQFQCGCGWRSSFPEDFIEAYRNRWSLSRGDQP